MARQRITEGVRVTDDEGAQLIDANVLAGLNIYTHFVGLFSELTDVDKRVSLADFLDLVRAAGPGYNAYILTAVPSDGFGSNGDVAVVDNAALNRVHFMVKTGGSWVSQFTIVRNSEDEILETIYFEATASYYYYGCETASGTWKINRFSRSTALLPKTSADVDNNDTYTALVDAWPDRVTLTYA